MSYDAEVAWEKYKHRATEQIMKSSLEGKLDTIAQALNEVLVNSERTAAILPQLAGDTAAIETAGDSYDPASEGMDNEYMVGDEGGAMPEEGGMPEEGVPADMGGAPTGDEGGELLMDEEKNEKKSEDSEEDFGEESTEAEVSEPTPEEGETDVTVGEGDIDVPSMDTDGAPSMDEDVLDEDISFSEGMEDDIPEEGEVAPDADIGGGDPLEDAYRSFTETLKQAAHRAIDEGRMEDVNKLAEAQATIDSIWGNNISPTMHNSIEGMDGLVEDPTLKSCVEKSDSKIAEADQPAVASTDSVTPSNSKAKVDTPIETPAEAGKFEEKGGAPKALDNVSKSADTVEEEVIEEDAVHKSGNEGEGEHEEEVTEFENSNTAPTSNSANKTNLGTETQAELENALFKSNKEAVPSLRDFMNQGNTFELAIDNLRKSSAGLGTELVMKKGMGCTGGLLGVMAYQNSIAKAAMESAGDDLNADIGSEDNSIGELSDPESDFDAADDVSDYDMAAEDGMEGDNPLDEPLTFGDEDLDPDFADDAEEMSSVSTEGVDTGDEDPEMPVAGMENIEASADTASEDPVDDTFAITAKSGKHITSFREMMDSAIMKSGENRPPCTTSVGGDVRRPEFGKPIMKSQNKSHAPVRMGFGVDPSQVTKDLWDEYNLYKSRPEL